MKLTPLQQACLQEASTSPDGTVLSVGFGKHGFTTEVNRRKVTVHATATADALARRGLMVFLKTAAWGNVYKITQAGRDALASGQQKG